MEFDELSNRVIGCAIEVPRKLGPGLLESTYEQCLAHELKLNGIRFKPQHPQPVEYKGVRLDLLVEDKLIIELKSVEQIKGALPQGDTSPRASTRRSCYLHEAGRGEGRTPAELHCHHA